MSPIVCASPIILLTVCFFGRDSRYKDDVRVAHDGHVRCSQPGNEHQPLILPIKDIIVQFARVMGCIKETKLLVQRRLGVKVSSERGDGNQKSQKD